MISALKLRQDPSPHLSKLFSSEYPSAATFLVDTPTDVLPKKNRRYGVDDLDARVNEIANAIQRTAGKASLGDRKLIQLLGKSIYDNRRKIRKNMLSSLSFLTYRD